MLSCCCPAMTCLSSESVDGSIVVQCLEGPLFEGSTIPNVRCSEGLNPKPNPTNHNPTS